MILTINTSQPKIVELLLQKDKNHTVASLKISAAHRQAEILLPALEKILRKAKLSLTGIKAIKIFNQGQGFTSLRIGVVTANALAYALNVPILPITGKPLRKRGLSVSVPLYDKPPTITKKR